MYKIRTPEKTITAEGGSLLDILRKNGFFIDSPCGGRGTCGKCEVCVDGRRTLACRENVDRDMTVTIPETAKGSEEKRIYARRLLNLSGSGFGLAFDIGTTTIAGCLCDLSDGRVVRKVSATNMQRAYGADVMSRVEHCVRNGTGELCGVVRGQLEKMSAELSDGVQTKRTVIAANTVMSHIYMNAPLDGLAAAPFKPEFLDTCRNGDVWLMPGISAYIGADITASMLACGMDAETRTVMLLDLGTNGELVLLHGGAYYCCSVSAGPALEGAGISCGMGASDGAVCGFEIIGGIPSVTTVNKASPTGICGAGLIAVAAALLKNKIIDAHGTFSDKRTLSSNCVCGANSKFLRDSMSRKNSELSAYMSDKGFRVCGGVYVTQDDIRRLQTVKSAIYSGILVLINAARISPSDIDEVYLCGGLGSNFNAEHAFAVGLLPSSLRGKITVCGNTALSGAAAAVCDMSLLEKGDTLRERSQVIELGGLAEFERLFIENIDFHCSQ